MTMPDDAWKTAILRWRALSPQRKREIHIRHIARKAARSMAFEGEAVDLELLEKALERLLTQRLSPEGPP